MEEQKEKLSQAEHPSACVSSGSHMSTTLQAGKGKNESKGRGGWSFYWGGCSGWLWGAQWADERGTEGQSCVTTRPLAGPHHLSHAPAPCLRQGSHRAWLWKALLGGSTAGPWHSWGAPAAWGNTSYSRKSTQPQGSMKMPLQVRVLHPGGMNTAKSQPGQMDLSGLQKTTVLMSASPEVVVRKLKVGSHTVWGANQDQRAIRKQNSCPWFFISHIYREHGYIDIHPHTYRAPRA